LPYPRRLSYFYLTGNSLHYSHTRSVTLLVLALLVCPPPPYTRDHTLRPKIGV
jgi:hypothetical protein